MSLRPVIVRQIIYIKLIANSKLIVLDSAGNPVGAYPFTSEQREHRVHINNVTAYCMCALDALAVSPMFNKPTDEQKEKVKKELERGIEVAKSVGYTETQLFEKRQKCAEPLA